jgi:hypothetical protein
VLSSFAVSWAVLAWSLVVTLQAQPPPAPAVQRVYRPNIADEDWSFLANKALRQDLYDPIKYVPLWGGKSYLTFGGEARIRPEGLRLRAAPGQESTVDNYVFQRPTGTSAGDSGCMARSRAA